MRWDQGEGGPQDSEKARYWYEQAAAQGFSMALFNLGWVHWNAEGVPHNPDTALSYWTRAAMTGDAEMQYTLAAMYFPAPLPR